MGSHGVAYACQDVQESTAQESTKVSHPDGLLQLPARRASAGQPSGQPVEIPGYSWGATGGADEVIWVIGRGERPPVRGAIDR
jgi:hypothetical protein